MLFTQTLNNELKNYNLKYQLMMVKAKERKDFKMIKKINKLF